MNVVTTSGVGRRVGKIQDERIGNIRFKKIICIETGAIRGTIAYRYNEITNTFQAAWCRLNPAEQYDRQIGNDLALSRFHLNDSHYIEISPFDIWNYHDLYTLRYSKIKDIPIRCFEWSAIISTLYAKLGFSDVR